MLPESFLEDRFEVRHTPQGAGRHDVTSVHELVYFLYQLFLRFRVLGKGVESKAKKMARL